MRGVVKDRGALVVGLDVVTISNDRDLDLHVMNSRSNLMSKQGD